MTTIDTEFKDPGSSANLARPASSTIGWMLLVSVLFHVMLLLHFGQHHENVNKRSLNRSLVISLSKITPEVSPQLRQEAEQSQQSRSEQSIPLLVKESQSMSRYKLNKKLKTEQKPDRLSSESKKQLKQQAQKQTEVAAVDTALVKKTRDQYMKMLAAHLDRHKFYPRSARRRHVEGKVEVSFDLLTNGQIINLHTLSGHPVLQKAAMDSIYSALPMPARPEALLALNTMKIEYSMQYDLK